MSTPNQPMPSRIIIGITGASGAAYSLRTIELLLRAGVEVHLTASTLGKRLLNDELGLNRLTADTLMSRMTGLPPTAAITIHNDNDLGATIASGSFLHDGMIVVPCSSNTMGAIAAGITQSLVQRAAMVTLKERRPLVLAHRESPLSRIDIHNMSRLSDAGAIIAPLSPGFYMLPTSVEDVVDFMAGKLLDLVKVPHDLKTRWGE
ncbi:MAG TPA: UbiX family flavin prenyltransferase [Phycisphaerales bacterium]|nr:UbiX family flavin prenyltransferase [Phycisphaerales bacterium]HRQ76765.1 UbiX family flavin prenyltransferase [Phycisphaerales bacterium]